MDILLYRAMPYVRNRELEEYENVGFENLRLTNRAKRKILRKIKRIGAYYERHAEYRPAVEMLKRVAVIVLVILSLGFVGTMAIEAVRASLWETIVEWYEESIFYKFGEEKHDALPTEILEYKEPVLGDEYERYVVIQTGHSFHVEYESDEYLIVYKQSLLADNNAWLSNNETEMAEILVNGNFGVLLTLEYDSLKNTMIRWDDGIYIYQLSADLSYEELLKIAETIH